MKKVQIVIVLLCFVAFNVSFCHNDENYENYENLRNKRSILKTDENPNSVVSIDSYQSIRGGNANATEQMIVKIKLWFDRASSEFLLIKNYFI